MHVHAFTHAVSVAIHANSCRRRRKNRRWPKPANGSSRIASSGTTSICRRNSPRSMIRRNRGIAAGDGPWLSGRLAASESLGRVRFLGGQASGFGRNQAPKGDQLNQVPSWELRNRRKSLAPPQLAKILWDFAYLCWANPIGRKRPFATRLLACQM